jgi:hypothetical protein
MAQNRERSNSQHGKASAPSNIIPDAPHHFVPTASTTRSGLPLPSNRDDDVGTRDTPQRIAKQREDVAQQLRNVEEQATQFRLQMEFLERLEKTIATSRSTKVNPPKSNFVKGIFADAFNDYKDALKLRRSQIALLQKWQRLLADKRVPPFLQTKVEPKLTCDKDGKKSAAIRDRFRAAELDSFKFIIEDKAEYVDSLDKRVATPKDAWDKAVHDHTDRPAFKNAMPDFKKILESEVHQSETEFLLKCAELRYNDECDAEKREDDAKVKALKVAEAKEKAQTMPTEEFIRKEVERQVRAALKQHKQQQPQQQQKPPQQAKQQQQQQQQQQQRQQQQMPQQPQQRQQSGKKKRNRNPRKQQSYADVVKSPAQPPESKNEPPPASGRPRAQSAPREGQQQDNFKKPPPRSPKKGNQRS